MILEELNFTLCYVVERNKRHDETYVLFKTMSSKNIIAYKFSPLQAGTYFLSRPDNFLFLQLKNV